MTSPAQDLKPHTVPRNQQPDAILRSLGFQFRRIWEMSGGWKDQAPQPKKYTLKTRTVYHIGCCLTSDLFDSNLPALPGIEILRQHPAIYRVGQSSELVELEFIEALSRFHNFFSGNRDDGRDFHGGRTDNTVPFAYAPGNRPRICCKARYRLRADRSTKQ
jgi:hypothetical protein